MRWLIGIWALCLSTFGWAQTPNIVLIIADDLGYGDVGAYGATDILTPSIDSLAAEGVKLNAFYTSPSCSLSRSMLMTGSYAPRLSGSRNYTPSSAVGIHANEITLAEMLKAAGCDGHFRQVAPWRSLPVPAAAPWLRRVLRDPVFQ